LFENEGSLMAPRLEDRRVQRTRRHLHEAFIALVVEKGYEAITVQDVLDRADVGRSTFYAHFSGKQDLLLKGLEGLRDWLSERQKAAETADQWGLGFSLAMFEHVAEQRKLYRAMVGKQSGALVQKHLQRVLADLVRSELAARAPRGEGTPVPLDLLAEFAASTFMALLAWWMDNRKPYTAAQIDEIYRRLVTPGIASALGPGTEPRNDRGTARRV
jgi:AcrR family transcriptional regulator